ncbi:hypothetical protein BC834DRAFT_335601 [Gloeopeniophorella convolvens]|nr:hypothetical protein BC834DRAFT_335601 [Gloeopeniophorella convolvens]
MHNNEVSLCFPHHSRAAMELPAKLEPVALASGEDAQARVSDAGGLSFCKTGLWHSSWAISLSLAYSALSSVSESCMRVTGLNYQRSKPNPMPSTTRSYVSTKLDGGLSPLPNKPSHKMWLSGRRRNSPSRPSPLEGSFCSPGTITPSAVCILQSLRV